MPSFEQRRKNADSKTSTIGWIQLIILQRMPEALVHHRLQRQPHLIPKPLGRGQHRPVNPIQQQNRRKALSKRQTSAEKMIAQTLAPISFVAFLDARYQLLRLDGRRQTHAGACRILGIGCSNGTKRQGFFSYVSWNTLSDTCLLAMNRANLALSLLSSTGLRQAVLWLTYFLLILTADPTSFQ